ncbi:MAG: hypothetical protein M1826_003685 [Phylliscum demangeonii]|nr:MAG: hypothetical protein M1826_003685 [Phylliscum demangeonii]
MCGRYALALRASEIRMQLESYGLPVGSVAEDDATRPSYNVAPGYHEPIYRANVPDHGAGGHNRHHPTPDPDRLDHARGGEGPALAEEEVEAGGKEVGYTLQAMKWGLVPFWTKRNPDYGSMLKTINCRDDSLRENKGMWNTMKQTKRCVVLAQGFYEWLKKNGGKEKIPHFVKRRDGKLMCFAGLWDCVQYEGSAEKLYSYTIITTDSNKQLKFLHDRMPVILDPGSDAMATWLDAKRCTWSKELQSLLKPYPGELDVYPVSKEVGKVGNNSPTFMVPISSTDNKNNIANFFSHASAKGAAAGKGRALPHVTKEQAEAAVWHDPQEGRSTTTHQGTEDNAPLPGPARDKGKLQPIADDVMAGNEKSGGDNAEDDDAHGDKKSSGAPTRRDEDVKGEVDAIDDRREGVKREHQEVDPDPTEKSPRAKIRRREGQSPPSSLPKSTSTPTRQGRQTRSATSNRIAPSTAAKQLSDRKGQSQRITNFFHK